MNGIPLHPVIVHLPLVLALLAPLVLLVVTIRGRGPGRTRAGWLVAAGLQAAVVVGGLAAMRTGHADEDRVERVVPEAAIEAHEEAAETFVWGAALALAVTVGALLVHRAWAGGVATAAALVIALLGVRTGHAGGQLVYRDGAGAAWAQASAAPAASGAPSGHLGDDD